jgi:glutamate/tyrosine decarboxylase-like PLP-dependent enzyme
MTLDHASLRLLAEALQTLERGFDNLPQFTPEVDPEALGGVLQDVAERLRDNYPYHHPLYVGQMLKPPHAVARLAYALATWINPNNHALDGGRASSRMEKEAVAQIAGMFGWETHLGHLCSGGTMANFEALWAARQLQPGTAIAASQQAHYTHARLSAVLDVPFVEIAVDPAGRMDLERLEQALTAGRIGTVVATLGTTAAGAVDPLPDLLRLRERFAFRIHADAAYGGYFRLAGNLPQHVAAALESLSDVDSLVIDPHKHGLQPYGCGCVLFRDPAVGRVYQHHSPYTYFTSNELHLGEISLECSRPGASAVALWATMRLLPLAAGGEFAAGLETCRTAALDLHAGVKRDPRFVPLFDPELDIVVWAVRAPTARESSERARRLFAEAAARDLHLALATFPRELAAAAAPVQQWDAEEIVCLRACAMKPEHAAWVPEILARLSAAADNVGCSQ